MKIRNAVLLSLVSTFFSLTVSAKELVTLKDYLKSELSSSAKMSKESFPLSAEDIKALKAVAQSAEDTSLTFYYGKAADGKLEKACSVVPQKGKEGPISAGICFNSAGTVTGVTILSHQEERGKGIDTEAFLKQFKGKKMSDAFAVGKDVDGISGATWSSQYVSEAVRKASFGFKKFVGGK